VSFEETYIKKRAESLLLLTPKLVSLNGHILFEMCSALCISVSLVLSCLGDKTCIQILVKEKSRGEGLGGRYWNRGEDDIKMHLGEIGFV